MCKGNYQELERTPRLATLTAEEHSTDIVMASIGIVGAASKTPTCC